MRMTNEKAIALLKEIEDEYGEPIEMAIEALKERKTGKWITKEFGQECGCCGEIQYGFDNRRQYCPCCGVRMEVDE